MEKFTNFSIAKLAAGIDNAATEFTVETGKGANFLDPAEGEMYGVIWDSAYASPAFDANREWVKVGARTTDTFSSVTRAQRGTSAVNHNTAGHEYYFMAAAGAEWLNNLVAYSKYIYLEASAPDTVTIVEQRGFTTPVTAEIAANVLTLTSDAEFTSNFIRSAIGYRNRVVDADTITVDLYDSFESFAWELKLK